MFWVVVLCCKALTANTVLFFKLFASGHLCEAVKRGLEQLLSELRRVHITELIIHSLYHNKPWDQSHSSAAERSVRASSYMDSKTKEGKFIQTKLWMAHTHTHQWQDTLIYPIRLYQTHLMERHSKAIYHQSSDYVLVQKHCSQSKLGFRPEGKAGEIILKLCAVWSWSWWFQEFL